jgi:tRNA(Ile)-lysidine synthase
VLFLKETIEFINSLNLANKTVIVAVSGGADSLALMHLLTKIKDIKLVCSHVNHKQRIESESEKIMVEEYCQKWNVIFEYKELKEQVIDNFHEFARGVRYKFFEELLKKYNSTYLFTAHHNDDLIETILFRFLRGSNINGYAGFKRISKVKNYNLIRPFINLSKEDILEYVANEKLNYATDLSNFKDVYMRNRIRKYIVPELKKECPKIKEKALKFSNILNDYSAYIKKITEQKYQECYINNYLDITKLKNEDILIQKEVLYLTLINLKGIKINEINDKHTEYLLKMIANNKNSFLNLPGNIGARKEYDKIIFNEENNDKAYKIEIKEKTVLPNNKVIEIVKEEELDNNFVCRLNKEDIKLPLYVRSKKIGDKICLKGLEKEKKVKDIFINEKVPLSKRTVMPILVDSNDLIVWLPGLKKSKFDKTKKEKYDIILKYY